MLSQHFHLYQPSTSAIVSVHQLEYEHDYEHWINAVCTHLSSCSRGMTSSAYSSCSCNTCSLNVALNLPRDL